MTRPIAVTCLVVGVWVTPYAVERTLTPKLIQEAIGAGEISKRYEIQDGPFVLGYIATPFARVAQAAAAAKRHYLAFTPADVTSEMLAGELWVYVHALNLTSSGSADIRNVDTIVIARSGATDLSEIIQPIRTEPLSAEYQNLYGAQLKGRGLLAVFPLDVFSEQNELRIVYDRRWSCGRRINRDITDCRLPFTAKNIREIR